jgi:aryl-alcohol dehydrogenase-like predicted oxidoreductase
VNVPELILGTAQLTSAYGITRTTVKQSNAPQRLLAAASRLGIRTVDTAPAYGEAEAVIGRHGWEGAVQTKLERGVDPRASLTASLTALRRDRVEVLYIHASEEMLDPMSSVVTAAGRLVGDGADALGASVYSVEEFEAANLTPDITVIQVPVNVLDRRFVRAPSGATDRAVVRIIARSVFLQGVLLADPAELPRAVAGLAPIVAGFRAIAAGHATTPAALALAWVQTRTRVDGVVIGVQDERELEEVVAAWRADVDADAIAEVDGLVPPAPALVDPRRWTA